MMTPKRKKEIMRIVTLTGAVLKDLQKELERSVDDVPSLQRGSKVKRPASSRRGL